MVHVYYLLVIGFIVLLSMLRTKHLSSLYHQSQDYNDYLENENDELSKTIELAHEQKSRDDHVIRSLSDKYNDKLKECIKKAKTITNLNADITRLGQSNYVLEQRVKKYKPLRCSRTGRFIKKK